MDFSRLSYSQVSSIADQLKSSANEMEALLQEVKSLLEKVGNDDVWSGTAASNTKETFDVLSAKFPEFSTAIDDCHKYLMSVLANYKAVDDMVIGQ